MTYNSSLCSHLWPFVSLQLALWGVAVDVDSNKAWQWEKAQTLGLLNAVAMGDDASWLCCCHGNSYTWPNLVQTWITKGSFFLSCQHYFLSVQSENIEPTELFPWRYSLPYKLFAFIIGKSSLLEFLLLAGVCTYRSFV